MKDKLYSWSIDLDAIRKGIEAAYELLDETHDKQVFKAQGVLKLVLNTTDKVVNGVCDELETRV